MHNIEITFIFRFSLTERHPDLLFSIHSTTHLDSSSYISKKFLPFLLTYSLYECLCACARVRACMCTCVCECF